MSLDSNSKCLNPRFYHKQDYKTSEKENTNERNRNTKRKNQNNKNKNPIPIRTQLI